MSYKRWLLVSTAIFVAGLLLGLVTPVDLLMTDEAMAYIGELAEVIVPFSAATAVFIFVKNALVLLFSFALSPLLCLMPVLSLTLNGVVVTLLSGVVIQEESLGFLLMGLLPHGILEIPALIMGQAAALSFGVMVILAIFRREKRAALLPNLKQNLKYLAIAVALFLPAAFIETYVTSWLLIR
ncbi:stage II sporulation protein M [Chloroflexota bacterium]